MTDSNHELDKSLPKIQNDEVAQQIGVKYIKLRNERQEKEK